MPLDPTEASAPPTTRRGFLARAALGGAVVSVAAAADPLRLLTGTAGARPATGARVAQAAELDAAPAMSDQTFAALGAPLELAAVQAYQAALNTERLDVDWTETATSFQDHHQAAADTYTEQIAEGAKAPVADADVLDSTVSAIDAAGDQAAVLAALAELEETLAATALYAIGGLTDTFFAKTVGQIMAVESQQAVVLGRAGGTDIVELTPAEASTEGAETGFTQAYFQSTTTTTTTTAPSAEESGN